MKFAFRRASLSIWELKGAPETWRAQLEAYYTREPVFVVLGGMSNQSWEPIHTFCEEQRIPCLFPVTDFPVVTDTGWYTYYFSKGYAQEGEAVSRFTSIALKISPLYHLSSRLFRILPPARHWHPVLIKAGVNRGILP